MYVAQSCKHLSTQVKKRKMLHSHGKIREDTVGGPARVFARKTVNDETPIRKSSIICKSIVGIDASQP